MADFNFFLNTQGLRGRTGAKGADGFAPVIAIGQNTLNTFTLLITTADGTFETPNLRGSIINNAGSGTFLRYDAETDSIYLSELPTASETEVGGVTIATDEELANAAGTGVVTADSMGVGIYGALKAGNNISLSLDNETGLVTINSVDTKYTLPVATTDTLGGVKPDGNTITITEDGKISAVGGGQGTLNYEELTNKPSLYGTEIVGDKKLSDFVEFKAPLKETIAVDYEKDVVIVNGNKTDDSLTLNTSWAPLFTDTSSASLPFDITGDVTLNGNEFTPSSGVEMPFKPGDIIGVPGDTGADIALGNIREDGQFIFTHLIRIDGLGVSYINKAFMPVATKTNSSGTLKCTCDSTVTSELTTGQNFTDNIAYFQVRVEDGKMVAVCLKSVGGVFSNGVKVTSSNSTTVANSEKLQRFSFGGVGSNVNPLNQFKLYRNTGLKLEECADQSVFAGLTNMVNWKFPDDTTSISIKVDNDTVKIDGDGQLAVTDKVVKNNELDTYIKAGKDIEIRKDETTNVLTIGNSAGNPFYKDLQGLPNFKNPLSKTVIVTAPITGLSINGNYLNVDVYTSLGQTISGTSATSTYNFTIKKTYCSSYDVTNKTLKPKSYVAIPYSMGQIFSFDAAYGSAKALLAAQQEDGTFEILGAVIPHSSPMDVWYVAARSSSYSGDTITFSGYRGSYTYPTEYILSNFNKYQTVCQFVDNGDTVKFTTAFTYEYNSTTRSSRTRRVIDDATEVAQAKKVTHILVSGFPTNTNTWLTSSFGLYASDGNILCDSITPGAAIAQPNLFNINENTETININCKVDGQTVVIDSNGNLSVGDDVLLKEQLYTQVVPGDNISITEDANTHKITISSTGGGGGSITELNTEYPLVYEQAQVAVDGNVINGTVENNVVTLNDTAYTVSTSNLGIKSNTAEGDAINGIEPTSCVFLDFNVEHAYLLPTTNRRPVIFGKKVGKKGIIPKYLVNTADNLVIYSIAGTPTFDSASSTYNYVISALSSSSSGTFTSKYVMSYFGFHVSGTDRVYQGITATSTSSKSPYTNYTLSETDLSNVDTVCYFNDAGVAMDFNSKNYGELTVDIFSASQQDPSASSNRIANTMVVNVEGTVSALKLKYDSNTLGLTSNNELYVKPGGGEGGASIDDSTTSSTTTWSSEKINTELTSRDATITEAQNEITLVQGDVAALDADVSTLKTTMEEHTTSISSINTLITQLTDRIAALEAEINGGNA